MKRILNLSLMTVALVAMVALNSCILDPEKTPEKDEGPGNDAKFESLEQCDHVLNNLELAYNTRNIDEYARILDEFEFTFFFSPADVNSGNVNVSQWGRAEEVGATRNMFDPSFNPENGEPISSISLTLQYAEGDGSWLVIPGDPGSGHEGEDWYSKTASYIMNVQAGETTFVTGTPIDVRFTVRQVEVDGKQIYQMVEWADDI